MTCTANLIPENGAWKQCVTHGAFPCWYARCPETPIPSSGDTETDAVIDRLLAPGTTEGERDRMRTKYAESMRLNASRLVPMEAS